MSSPYSLVSEQFATEWIETHRTESQRRASLGDYEALPPELRESVVRAHNALVGGLEKIEGLVRDPTRTPVSKHAVARDVANKARGTIEKSASEIAATAASFEQTAHEMVVERFEVDPKRASIQSEIRGWIRETAKGEMGLATIRKAMNESVEVAAVLYHSPNFLLGLAQEVRASMVADGIEKYVPKAATMMADSERSKGLAIKYGHVSNAMKRSFYNSALADQASLRVEA